MGPGRRGKPNSSTTESASRRCPPEIWRIIADSSDLKECRSLRLVNRRIEQATRDSLNNRYTVLYLHPTRNSMRNILDICYSGLYTNITELCLLGDPMWSEISAQYPHYRPRREGQEEAAAQQCMELNKGHRFKPWPGRYDELTNPDRLRRQKAVMQSNVDLSNTTSFGLKTEKDHFRDKCKGKSKSKERSYETRINDATGATADTVDPTDFNSIYKPLIDALVNLKKLHTLSYRESADRPGLNAVSTARIRSHAYTVARKQQPWTPSPTRPQSDATVFYCLFATLYQRRGDMGEIQKLDLGNQLPFTGAVFAHFYESYTLLPKSPTCPMDNAFSHLKYLDISIDCGWVNNEPWYMQKVIIHKARHSLESLRVRLIPNPVAWQQDDRKAESVHGLLKWIDEPDYAQSRMPKLTSLEVLYVDDALTETVSRQRSNRWRRPAVVRFETRAFWDMYIEQLTTFRLQHVVTWDPTRHVDGSPYAPSGYTSAEFGIPQTMKEDLTRLRDRKRRGRLKLRHFEWTVPFFQHDPRCKADDAVAPGSVSRCRRHHCGSYYDITEMPSEDRDMKEMADDFGVELDETGVWDYGAFIMRDGIVDGERS